MGNHYGSFGCCELINQHGIQITHTATVTTTETSATYKISHCFLRRLCGNEGVFILNTEIAPPPEAATFPIFICDGKITKQLLFGNGQPVTGADILAGNYYWFEYNKCLGIIKMMNAATVALEPTAAAALNVVSQSQSSASANNATK